MSNNNYPTEFPHKILITQELLDVLDAMFFCSKNLEGENTFNAILVNGNKISCRHNLLHFEKTLSYKVCDEQEMIEVRFIPLVKRLYGTGELVVEYSQDRDYCRIVNTSLGFHLIKEIEEVEMFDINAEKAVIKSILPEASNHIVVKFKTDEFQNILTEFYNRFHSYHEKNCNPVSIETPMDFLSHPKLVFHDGTEYDEYTCSMNVEILDSTEKQQGKILLPINDLRVLLPLIHDEYMTLEYNFLENDGKGHGTAVNFCATGYDILVKKY
jgi:hypothetical protein